MARYKTEQNANAGIPHTLLLKDATSLGKHSGAQNFAEIYGVHKSKKAQQTLELLFAQSPLQLKPCCRDIRVLV